MREKEMDQYSIFFFLLESKTVSGDYFGGREQPKFSAMRAKFSDQKNERWGLSRWQSDPR